MRRVTPAPRSVQKKRAHFDKQRATPFKSWSFSAWEVYDACPLKYKFQYIQKVRRGPPPAAVQRGNEIHQGAEDYLKAKTLGVPMELGVRWSKLLTGLRKEDAVSEEPWAFTQSWEVTTWNDDEAWLRMKLDARVDYDKPHIKIIDFKTGGIYPKHKDQVDLYALGAFCRYPEVETADVAMWYLDQRKIVTYEYEAGEADDMRAKWVQRARDMAKDRHHLPDPGRHCKWCDFNVRRGGECKHGARYS